MNHSNAIEIVDCRGQSCPAPILATARAARALKSTGGGVLEVEADDDAFPLDIQSWCRSSGSELMAMTTEGGVHRARVRVGGALGGPVATRAPIAPPPPSASASMSPAVELIDCRGQQCPQPILSVARTARKLGGGVLEVLADDPAFRLDIESWCRSAGATLESVSEEGNALRARVRLAGTPERVAASAASASSLPRLVRTDGPAQVNVSGLAGAPRTAALDAFAASRGGQTIEVLSDDTAFSGELVAWATQHGHRLVSLQAREGLIVELELAGAAAPVTALATVPDATAAVATASNQCTILVLHNDKEALLAALLVGVGAASQGMDVMMFFTFWGLNLLRGDEPNTAAPKQHVSWMQKMMKWMMPRGPKRQKLGQMDMAGIGRGMLGSIMRRYQLMDVPELMVAAEEQGVRFVACTMSMQVMGITKRDLAPRANLDYGGVAAFVESAANSRMSLTF